MMPTLGAVNYAASYFTYKTPTPIHGTPTHKALKQLKQELRTNSSSEESYLGGGGHGYLELVSSNAKYTAIVSTSAAFRALNYLVPLIIPHETDQVAAFTLSEQYNKNKRLYYECKNARKSLQRHIQDAINPNTWRYLSTKTLKL